MAKPKKKPEKAANERSKAETEKVRDATLKNMLNTPPKPHKDEPKRGKKGGDGK